LSESIGYRSWNRIRNSGDAITPYIMEKLTDRPTRLVGPDVPHILGVGSILFFANERSHVWGSGVLNPDMPLPDIHKSTFRAVRGKKTYSFLKGLGVRLPDLPLGDPGIFAREVCGFPASNAPPAKYRAAFVPHHGSIHHPLYQKVKENKEFILVDILDDTLLPLQQIAQSDIVVSQSLHGLIYAESLGKPNVWISERQDDIWRFKFDDWYSTVIAPQRMPDPLTLEVGELLRRAEVRGIGLDKGQLAQALPAEAVLSPGAPTIGFRSCRHYNPAVFFVDTLLSGQSYAPAQRPADLLGRLGKRVFPMVYRLFQHWAERSYCLIVPADEAIPIDPAKVNAMVRFLDENAATDIAFVIERGRLGDLPAIEECDGGLGVVRKGAIAGGAILIRPDSFQLGEHFVTFCV
jgi:hypothetical protein